MSMSNKMTIGEFLLIKAERRRKMRLSALSSSHKSEPRRSFSREELLRYLKDNRIRSSRALNKIRKIGEPTVYDYQKEFGNWSTALEEAAATDPRNTEPPRDAKYYVEVLNKFEIETVAQYKAAHKKFPQTVPSFHQIVKEFGRFSNLKIAAKYDTLKGSLTQYLRLKRRYDRLPTCKECRDNRIDIDRLLAFFGSKKKLDAIAENLKE